MSDISPGYGVTFAGPFPAEHRVVVEGREIPNLAAYPSEDGSTVRLLLDRRFGIDGTPEEVAKWVHFVANAMAVAGGWAWLGADKKYEQFAPIVATINPPPNLRVVPKDDRRDEAREATPVGEANLKTPNKGRSE